MSILSNIKTLSKKHNTYQITYHGQQRLQQRFGHLKTQEEVQDSFKRSKVLTSSNISNHKHYTKKFYRLQNEYPNSRLWVNPHHDMVFVVDGSTIITVYYYDNSQYYKTGSTIKYSYNY